MSGIDRIHVVCAAIIRDGRILLAQRASDTSFPWAWCTPGGNVEPGESPLDALRRELREELFIELFDDIAELHPPTVQHALTVTYYRLEWDDVLVGPHPGDKIVGVGWFSADELDRIQLTPADHEELERLRGLLRGPL